MVYSERYNILLNSRLGGAFFAILEGLISKMDDFGPNHVVGPPIQVRIQSKLEGEAVGSGGAEQFSKSGDKSTLYTTISVPFSELTT